MGVARGLGKGSGVCQVGPGVLWVESKQCLEGIGGVWGCLEGLGG